jgi:hypothetical protein
VTQFQVLNENRAVGLPNDLNPRRMQVIQTDVLLLLKTIYSPGGYFAGKAEKSPVH